MENSEIINAFLSLRYLADISCGEIKEIKLDEKAWDCLDKIIPVRFQGTFLGIKITKE
jgi:hypothetical protein